MPDFRLNFENIYRRLNKICLCSGSSLGMGGGSKPRERRSWEEIHLERSGLGLLQTMCVHQPFLLGGARQSGRTQAGLARRSREKERRGKHSQREGYLREYRVILI